MSKSGGTVNVQAKTSTLAWVGVVIVGIILMGGMGSLSGIAVQGAGAVAEEAMPCDPANMELFCPPARASGMNRGPTTPTTGAGMARVSSEELAQREAAKAIGDSLPPVVQPAPSGPPTNIPTLNNPVMGGILGEVPVIGGALEAGGTALGMGAKALGR